MRKEEQNITNQAAYEIFNNAYDQWSRNIHNIRPERLRFCNARVYETCNYYLLESYNTFVAAIDKKSGICVDVLRGEYGYTSTSAQHIAKFFSDYTSWKTRVVYRYYPI